MLALSSNVLADAKVGQNIIPSMLLIVQIMTIGNASSGMQTVFHEYIHYLVKATGLVNYPTWFNEGIAEFYATIQIKPDHVVIGNTLKRRASKNAGSKLIKLDPLMSETNRSKKFRRSNQISHKNNGNTTQKKAKILRFIL